MSTPMSAKRKLVAKRKAPATPDLDRESPSYLFMKKEVAHERNFPLEDMEKRPECKWTMDYLKRNKYLALGMIYEDELYPRLVRLFYQKIKTFTLDNGIECFEYSIDGFSRRITLEDLGQITNLPVRFEREKCPHLRPPFALPKNKDMFEHILETFTKDGVQGKGDSMILSSLPEETWLLDRILRENVFPLGHHSERRAEMLSALYAAYHGYFYSMPFLLMSGIVKMAQELRNRSPTGKARPLPYGFLITAILRHSGYPFDPEEPQLDVEQYLPMSAWIASYGRLALARKKRTASRAGTSTEAAATPPPTSGPTQPPGTSSTADTDIIDRLTRMESLQATLQSQQETIMRRQKRQEREHQRTDAVIRAIARHTLGEDYQSQIDTFETESAQRGKAAAAEETDSDTESEYDAEEDEDADSD